MEELNPIFRTALDVQEFMRSSKWEFCFIGGVALQRWGVPRFTADVDLTLLTGFGREREFMEKLLKRYKPRRPDTMEFGLKYRVLLLVDDNKIPIDIAMGAMPFEERTVRRATYYRISKNRELLTCSAEDLVVHKAFAGRDQDWLDIRGIVQRQKKLKAARIFAELKPLADLKEQPEMVQKLKRLLKNV